MADSITLARPYAQAAFAFALEQQHIDKWQQMLSFMAQVSQDRQMTDFLHRALAAEAMADLFIAICGDNIDPFGENFIRIMAENRRLTVLPEILAAFTVLRAEYEKTVEVKVTSALPLSDSQQAAINSKMTKRLARNVILDCHIDPSVIGGVMIETDDMVIDGTVRARLQRLADVLQS